MLLTIKKIFFEAMQARQNAVVYSVMAFALFMTLTIQGVIHGNLEMTHFAYALITASAFMLWIMVDHKVRQSKSY
ncbi:hypothetical protein GCM10027155_05750 [Acinetobacter apis]|uniref:Uncharacterized protein n=2 Tax=Acinetobacter apis TaxID=1229165 RepID=A0A217EED2_9GAMM|nr:hypothetical protein SAMN05444584_0581 [Acinetobacter apis]